MTERDYGDWCQEDEACQRCKAYDVRSRHCDELECDDGFCDEHYSDPINFGPGECVTMCVECCGTGIIRWCGQCGLDITEYEYRQRRAKNHDHDSRPT